MKVQRHYTRAGEGPYAGIDFEERECGARGPDGGLIRSRKFVVPKGWSQAAGDILAEKYARKAGVPSELEAVQEPGVPPWLRRSVPAPFTGRSTPLTYGAEADCRQVFRRLAGAWTYHAWKAGYFRQDAGPLSPGAFSAADEASALAFFEELQAMLALQVAAPNSPQWFNCFSGRERLITREYGAVALADVAGEEVTVWTRAGWRPGVVRDFGRQRLRRVTFAPAFFCGRSWVTGKTSLRVTVEVTPDHRWIRQDGTETTALAVGDLVASARAGGDDLSPAYRAGRQHGIIFGDGTAGYRMTGGGRTYRARLCGEKSSLAPAFDRVSYPDCYDGDALVAVNSAVDLKSLPAGSEGSNYLRGFLDGWAATDGSEKNAGTVRLSTSRPDAGEWLARNAAAAGWLLVGHSVEQPRQVQAGGKVYEQSGPQYSYVLTRAERAWRVTAVEDMDGEEAVYCAVVPGVGEFTLAAGILTGNCGLWWAYGIEGQAGGLWAADAAGALAEVADNYSRPLVHACFINRVEDSLLEGEGILPLAVREARIFKHGGGAGSNVSAIRGKDEPLSAGGTSSGLMGWLKGSDSFAGAIKSGGTTRRAAKMWVLDIDHPDVGEFIDLKVAEEDKAAALVAGTADMARAAELLRKEAAGALDQDGTAELSCLRSKLPAAFLARAKEAAYGPGPGYPLEAFPTHYEGPAYTTVTGQNANNSLRVSNEFLRRAWAPGGGDWWLEPRVPGGLRKKVNAADLYARAVRAAWGCGDPALAFGDTIEDWNPCKADGVIHACNPCAEYWFLDDTACNLASLNLVTFASPEGVNLPAFRHAVRLWTVVLDVTIGMAGYPSREIAAGSYAYRTLGLGYANLGAFLMRRGVPYDGEAGRAWCGTLTALMHFNCVRASAELARDLGAYPRFAANREHHLRVVANHASAVSTNAFGAFRGLSVEPRPLADRMDHLPPALWGAVLGDARAALQDAEDWGLRNAQHTLLAPTGTIAFVMDCDTTGVEPDFALVKHKRLAGGGEMKIVNQSVPPALKALGYQPSDIADILTYALGAGSLRGLPERLRGPLHLALSEWAEPGWEGRLRAVVDVRALLKEKADLAGLAAAEWDEVNAHVCGTMTLEGAPHLKEEHLAVFDCANPCGRKGTRKVGVAGHVGMVAAAQPFLSGAVSKTINLPNDALPASVDDAFRAAHALMLKDVAVYRGGSKMSDPLSEASGGASGPRPAARREEAPAEKFGPVTTARLAGDMRPPQEIPGSAAYRGPEAPPELLAGPSPKDVVMAAAREAPPAQAAVPGFWDGPGHELPGGPWVTAGRGTLEALLAGGRRRRELPNPCNCPRLKLRLAGHSLFLKVGEYADGSPGEVWLSLSKTNSTLRGMADAVAICVSHLLQYGVPLGEVVDLLVGISFEPAGPVSGHPRLRKASSFADLIGRHLGVTYLGRDDLAHVANGNGGPPAPCSTAALKAAVVTDLEKTARDLGGLPKPPGEAGPPPLLRVGVGFAPAPPSGQLVDPRAAPTPAELGRLLGYLGEPCHACGCFTLRRAGVCLSCDTCFASSGC